MRPSAAEVLAARAPAPAALAVSPCGCVAYAAHCEPRAISNTGANATLRAWDVRRGVCAWEHALPAAGAPAGLAAAHDGTVVFAAADGDADVAVLCADDGAPCSPLAPAQGVAANADAGITALALSADGTVLCVVRHSLRVDAYDIARVAQLSGTRWPVACTSAAATCVPRGVRVCALALAGAGVPAARTVFVAWGAECVAQLALQTGSGSAAASAAPALRMLRAAGNTAPLFWLGCCEPGAPGEPLLLYAGATHGRLRVWRLRDSSSSSSRSGGDDDTDGSEAVIFSALSPTPGRRGECALVAGGVCRLGGVFASLGSHQSSTRSTRLLAGENEAFVALAVTPCGAELVLASAAPRGCVLRRFVVAPSARFSRASARIHAPALRATFRAFLCCVFVANHTPPAAPHALHARLDAASRDAIIDVIFHALVRSLADDIAVAAVAARRQQELSCKVPLLGSYRMAADLRAAAAAEVVVDAVPLPRARDCARGLVMFHHVPAT
jgi:hypothetical protein